MDAGLQCTVLTQSGYRAKTSLPFTTHRLSLLDARVGLAGALGGLGVLVKAHGLFANSLLKSVKTALEDGHRARCRDVAWRRAQGEPTS